MILTTKHVPVEQSLVGLGAMILSRLNRPRTITGLWEEMRALQDIGSFDRFSLALSLLCALGTVDLSNGRLRRRSK